MPTTGIPIATKLSTAFCDLALSFRLSVKTLLCPPKVVETNQVSKLLNDEPKDEHTIECILARQEKEHPEKKYYCENELH